VFQVVRGEGRGWTSGGRWRGRAAGALPQLQVADRGGARPEEKIDENHILQCQHILI
jgi:hypothetical protein